MIESPLLVSPEIEQLLHSRFTEHLSHVRAVFERTVAVGAKFKLSKVEIGVFVADCFGWECGLGSYSPLPSRVQGLLAAPRPTRNGDVDALLGAFGYMRLCASPAFSSVAKPLRKHLKSRDPEDKLKKQMQDAPAAAWVDAQEVYFPAEFVPRFVPVSVHLSVSMPGEHLCTIERRPEHARASVRSGRLPWGDDEELSWRRLKAMAIDVVRVFLPDIPGAMSGANPFWIKPDASKLAFGGGLLQFARFTPQQGTFEEFIQDLRAT